MFFGQVVAHDGQTVLKNWDEIKRKKSQKVSSGCVTRCQQNAPFLDAGSEVDEKM